MSTDLFYCTPHIYPLGHILKPGRWASHVKSFGLNSTVCQLEAEFERVRAAYFNTKVSRLECLYAFANISDVDSFIIHHSNPEQPIYKLHVLDSATACSSHNYEIISRFLGYKSPEIARALKEHEHAIFDYWDGEQLTSIDNKFLKYVQEVHIGGEAVITQIF